MSEILCSVGLDVGTTTTQLIISELTVQNRASGFAVPEMEITDTLVGESVTEESPVARIEVKTRVYINPDDDPDYPAPSSQYCSHKEYGKGYKPWKRN